ncbi:hypothetical protein HS088_TW14G00795 [Tripterygium wilfordii]|uniref:BHLH domain-containing protein n=1 Tax=Tripterygium wilfordii TaxID=458696 RepID=A0A7J7CRM9_TRIWF|nr:transcription factor FAMA [Tripterygium wilfordii]KAF5736648.1 hypothetical protein HS088_TW14G00795 [Tripterygium wilfordii]
MEKEENYQASFMGSLDYSLDNLHQNKHMKPRIGQTSGDNNNNSGMIDYMLNQPHQQQQAQQISSSGYCTPNNSLDKLSFADVMQFADFGSKLGLNHQDKVSSNEEETGIIDPVYFLKFPVLNEKAEDPSSLMVPHTQSISGEMINEERLFHGLNINGHDDVEGEEDAKEINEEARVSDPEKNAIIPLPVEVMKNKRKRPRSIKTSEEVESQRMTHIAVERNRRKQMNEHLVVLRSLMPGSYVQRGDQASIIGGAIEFVRELEQLLQCLESQKRRRIYGEATPRQMVASGDPSQIANIQPPTFLPPLPLANQINDDVMNLEIGLREETAESKSCLADVEVKVLGFDAIIKILSRRRPGQLTKTIAGLEDLQLSILHTNITTIEQTVLYSFNVKVTSDSRFTAEDIANSVQQIFSFIHANTSI